MDAPTGDHQDWAHHHVILFLAERFGRDPASIQPSDSLRDQLDLDSLDFVEIIMAFEDKFDLDVPDEDTGALDTVQDLIDYLRKRMK